MKNLHDFRNAKKMLKHGSDNNFGAFHQWPKRRTDEDWFTSRKHPRVGTDEAASEQKPEKLDIQK